MEFRRGRADRLTFGGAVKVKVPNIVINRFATIGIDDNPPAAVILRHSISCRSKVKNLIS